jgi:uncharacterized phage protein gp47/JayE
MSSTTPTTKQISDNIIAQLQSSLNQTIPLLPKSFMRVLSKAIAAVFITLYKYGGFIFLQMFVSKASDQETVINGITLIPLVEWGRIIGVGDPASATSAEMIIDITVTNQTGQLDSGTQLANADNGVTYITIGTVLLDASIVQATIRAVADQSGGGGAGSIGNLDPGAIVSFVNPLPNVSRDAIVDSQTVTGADKESTEAYRQRVIDRWQKQPQGGAYADYEQWGEEPAGIINIYPYTGDPGQVDVYVEATPESSGDPDGIPTQAQLDEVAASIELDDNGLASRRPANALVNTLPITRTPFGVEVVGLIVENLSAVQASIIDALDEYFLSREPFITGLTTPPRRDLVSRSSISGIVDDIVSAENGVFTTVNLFIFGNEVETYFVGEGEKAKSGTITFI